MSILSGQASYNSGTGLWLYEYTLQNTSAVRITSFMIRANGALAVREPPPPYLVNRDLSTPYTSPANWHFYVCHVGTPDMTPISGAQFGLVWWAGNPGFTDSAQLAAGATKSGFSFTSTSPPTNPPYPDSFSAYSVFSRDAFVVVHGDVGGVRPPDWDGLVEYGTNLTYS